MGKPALPLDEENAPKRKCVHNKEVFCAEHEKMVHSRAVGLAALGIAKWAVPILLTVLIGTIGFLFNDVRRLEARMGHEAYKHSEIHETVHTIEFNLIRLFYHEGLEYITPGDE